MSDACGVNILQTVASHTSQVSYKVGEFHFPFSFDVFIVEVCVEHDGGERQQEDGVRSMKLSRCLHIALTVTISKRLQCQTTTKN